MKEEFQEYFDMIQEQTDRAYEVADRAREQGKDPEQKVDITRANDLAAKAVGLVTADQFTELSDGDPSPEDDIKERVRELEAEYGKNDERVAFMIGREIAQNEFYEFDDEERAADAGIRIGLSYMTGGIVTAPLEGIADVTIRDNDDGTRYLAVYYAGPIRSAGGTASAMSVLLADYVRKGIGLDRYKPRDEEVERYAVEVEDYFTRVTKKQYSPEREETRMIAENVPIEITGTPTESLDVSNHKDLDRVDTNRIRGGMCLVYLDGLPLKAPKIKKRITSYGDEFELGNWEWIMEYLDLQKSIHSRDDDDEGEEESVMSYEPSGKFLGNIVAGRPVFSHHGEKGGLRLRYGRSRTSGLAGCSFHPATMEICDEFMAVGTQLKVEYPGKGTVSTPCDSIEGPLVRLESGDVVRVSSREQAKEVSDEVAEILFVGDILVPFGEFVENGKDLIPSPYVPEWWALEVENAIEDNKGDLGEDLGSDAGEWLEQPFPAPSFQDALRLSEELGVPLHPEYTFLWHHTDAEDIVDLFHALQDAEERDGELAVTDDAKTALEELYIPHTVDGEQVVVAEPKASVLRRSLDPDRIDEQDIREDAVAAVEESLGVSIRDQAPIFLGSRMGRPEKAERRYMKGKPQLLFPCGKEEGGRMRNLMRSYTEHGTINEEILHNFCDNCNREVHFGYCPYCGESADEAWFCTSCGKRAEGEKCGSCGSETSRKKSTEIQLKELMNIAKRNLGHRQFPELLKSVRRVTGKYRHVEPLEKGLLRDKYDLYINKDGTIRYDSTDLTMTHFRPREIHTSVEELRELGYTEDINGEPLTDDDQVLQLKPQDIVISRNRFNFSGAECLYRVSRFVDDLLEQFYGIDSYYDFDEAEDVIGSLVIGLAPHTSGGIIGRIIGLTDAKGTYAHPYWHAAKRRNCDGDEDSVILLMDALLNFSRQFLPDQRGTRTMDAPLILSTVLNPDEVDDESWNVDVVDRYPLELYEASQEFRAPWDVGVAIAEDMIEEGTPFTSEYTHETSDIEDAPLQSNYVTLGSMSEKVPRQLDLGRRTRAVRENEVAELLLNKHFISDIKGNLRAFSEQDVRCVSCNAKYRRPPLSGGCTRSNCNGKLTLTVHEGSIRKYLEPSEEIAEEYDISTYMEQQILILKKQIISLFGKENRQSSLGSFTSE